MSKDRNADRTAAIETMGEAIAALMYAVQSDPDEEFAPHLVAPSAAYAAMCALEAAGFTVERGGPMTNRLWEIAGFVKLVTDAEARPGKRGTYRNGQRLA